MHAVLARLSHRVNLGNVRQKRKLSDFTPQSHYLRSIWLIDLDGAVRQGTLQIRNSIVGNLCTMQMQFS